MCQIQGWIMLLAVAVSLGFAPKTMLVPCPKKMQLLKAVNAKSWALNKPAVCWPHMYWLRPGNFQHKESLGRSFILISSQSSTGLKGSVCNASGRSGTAELKRRTAYMVQALFRGEYAAENSIHWKSALSRRFHQSCFWRHSHPFVSYRLNRYSAGFDLLRAHWCEVCPILWSAVDQSVINVREPLAGKAICVMLVINFRFSEVLQGANHCSFFGYRLQSHRLLFKDVNLLADA